MESKFFRHPQTLSSTLASLGVLQPQAYNHLKSLGLIVYNYYNSQADLLRESNYLYATPTTVDQAHYKYIIVVVSLQLISGKTHLLLFCTAQLHLRVQTAKTATYVTSNT